MKASFSLVLAFFFVSGSLRAQESFPGGIVYGPKAAFKISAPEGWVLDNRAGVIQGLPCVLHPKGESWQDARTIMDAKIASPEFTEVDQFVARAIKEMQKVHGTLKRKVVVGKTGDGNSFIINEYPATKSYAQGEQVAYVQLPGAVAYIVLSARESGFRKDRPTLPEVMKSFAAMELKSEKPK